MERKILISSQIILETAEGIKKIFNGMEFDDEAIKSFREKLKILDKQISDPDGKIYLKILIKFEKSKNLFDLSIIEKISEDEIYKKINDIFGISYLNFNGYIDL